MGSPAVLDDRRAKRLLLLAVIVSCLFGLKLSFLPGTGPYGLDGSFYVNAARNVQEGVGLKTNVSMYHYGQTDLPTRSALIYPLWPLLMGLVARLVGLVKSASYLPPLLFVLDLLLLYSLVSRLATRLGSATEGVFTPGHLLVLLLGCNYQFYGPTTFPYTEGLGFFFAFGALLLLDRAATQDSALFGVLAGVAAGLALLTRTQMVIVGLAMLIVVIWRAVSDRRFLIVAAAYAVVFAFSVVLLNVFVLNVEGSPRVSLPTFRMWLEPSSAADWWRERLQGLVVSLSPFDSNSFFAAFQTSLLIPILGSVLAVRRWFGIHRWSFRVGANRALPAASVLIAVGTFVSLNLFHQDPEFLMPWLFGYRHGLPMILGIAVATAFLWGLGRMGRIVTIACATIAILLGLVSILGFVTAPPKPSPTPSEAALANWLDRQPVRPVILTARSQHLSVYTHANIHWTECRTPAKTTRIMLEKLPIDSVIVYATERQCAFVDGLGDLLAERAAFGEGPDRIHVLGRRQAFPSFR